MKFKTKKTWYVKDHQEKCKTTKIYTDFYCSLGEWTSLGTVQKRMLIQQLLNKIDLKLFPNDGGWSFNFYFDKEEVPERKENNLYFEEVIKTITHRDVKVNVKYDWFNGPTLNHVKIVFPNTNMPNIFVLFDFTDYMLYVSDSSTSLDGEHNLLVEYLMICVDAIYKTLSDKTTEWYDKKLNEFYNENYDRIFYNFSTKLNQLLYEDREYSEDNFGRQRRYQKYFNCWQWNDVFKLASSRKEENEADVKWL